MAATILHKILAAAGIAGFAMATTLPTAVQATCTAAAAACNPCSASASACNPCNPCAAAQPCA